MNFPLSIMIKCMISPKKILIIMNEIHLYSKMYVFINFDKIQNSSNISGKKLRS